MTQTRPKTKVHEIVIHPPIAMEDVPVQRMAEYVPASFTSAVLDEDAEDDILHDTESRWYRVNENTLALSLKNSLMEFSIPALKALCERAETLSDVDIAQVLGLDFDDEPQE